MAMQLLSSPATCSASATWPGYPCTAAYPGAGGYFSTQGPYGNWWMRYDYGAAVTATHFVVQFGGSGGGGSWRIQYSIDDSSWIDASPVTAGSTSTTMLVGAPITARYWRIFGNSGSWSEVHELALYNDTEHIPRRPVSPSWINRALTSSGASVSTPSGTSAGAINSTIDQNNDTWWVSGTTVTSSFVVVDLGSVYPIIGIRLYQGIGNLAEVATDLNIQSSADGSSWNTIESWGALSGDQTFVLAQPHASRYWRLDPTAGGGSNWLIRTLELLQTIAGNSQSMVIS